MLRALKADICANHKSGRCTPMSVLALLCFSTGFQLLLLYRVQHALVTMTPLGKALAKCVGIMGKWLIACDVNPRATLGHGIRIPHATGIVIGEYAVIGNDVTLYQQVTIGQKDAQRKAAAVVGDGATLYAGCVLLGDIAIGKNASIGANAVVTQSIPDNATARGIPARLTHPITIMEHAA